MHPEKLTITRNDLYEKVWTTPVRTLARGFGLSDVGLAKLCRRHLIPVPGRGWWARLAAGHKLSRPPLPQNDDPRLDIIEIRPTDRPVMEGSPMQEKQPIPAIEVAPDRPLTHPLALEVERSVLRSTDERGLLLARKGRAVPVRVSPGSLPRALRILDALLFAIEGAGHTLAWPKPYDKAMKVIVAGEALDFSISETVKTKPHELTPQEKSRSWMAPRRDHHPTGHLKLSIDCDLAARIRRSWSDGKFLRVEKCLGRFLVALPLVAETLKTEREEFARRQREWEEQRKRDEEARRRREEYNRKAQALQKLAQSWYEANRLRGFAAEIKASSENASTPEDQRPDLASMAEFALRHANYLDPLTDLKWMLDQLRNPALGVQLPTPRPHQAPAAALRAQARAPPYCSHRPSPRNPTPEKRASQAVLPCFSLRK